MLPSSVRSKSAVRCYLAVFAASAVILAVTLTSCGNNPAPSNGSRITAVCAENEYADVVSQIGGKYVSVSSIISSPAADPHSYEAGTGDAEKIGRADIVVENGLGYDDFIDKLADASPKRGRVLINVANSLGYTKNTKNPHLWYKPDTMPKVAELVEKQLEKRMPSQKYYFKGKLDTFNTSLFKWKDELKGIKNNHGETYVAVTEPVADYLLAAAGLTVKTPWSFELSVMNGTDPTPQDVKTQSALISERVVKLLIYNSQASDGASDAQLNIAKSHSVPTVAVGETMPAKLHYQDWMETETQNIKKAIENGASAGAVK